MKKLLQFLWQGWARNWTQGRQGEEEKKRSSFQELLTLLNKCKSGLFFLEIF